MGIFLILALLQEEPATFGTSRAEVPVVGRPAIDDAFGSTQAEVPVVGRPRIDDSFGRAQAEVPVVAPPDLYGLGWSRPAFRARLASEPFVFAPTSFHQPALTTILPASIGSIPHASVSIAPPALPAAAAPAAVPDEGGGGRP